MRRLLTLTLSVAIASSLCAPVDAEASGRLTALKSTRAFYVDGVGRSYRRRPASTLRKRRGLVRKVKLFHTPIPPVPGTVVEINTEGLKELLRRDPTHPAKARPLLVNFWATWCDPCREEFPDLVKINNDYKDRGLDFVVVSGDEISEIKTGVPKFLQQMKASMPAYLLNVPDMELAINAVDTTWGGDMPATYLYDREGKIAFKHFGRVDPKELREALDKVLAN